MLRVIREVQPRWVVGENVFGLVNWNGGLVFDEVQSDLEAEGYEVQAFILPAASVGAPHRRDRVWFVAYSKSNKNQRNRQEGFFTEFTRFNEQWIATDPSSVRLQGRMLPSDKQPSKQQIEPQNARGDKCKSWHDFPTQSPICSGNDGVSPQLDGITFSKWRRESLKGYGNAIAPQVAYQIFKTINEYEHRNK